MNIPTAEPYGKTAAQIGVLKLKLFRVGMFLALGEIETAARLAIDLQGEAIPLIETWAGAADVFALSARISHAQGDEYRAKVFACSAYSVAALHLKPESLNLWALRELPAPALVDLLIERGEFDGRAADLG